MSIQENAEPVRRENKMGVLPIGKLLVSMSVPMMLSMLVMALYNIVDSIFVSWISEKALTAVSLAFPIQNLMIAFAVGAGVGLNSILSRRLGEKNYQAVNRAAGNGFVLFFGMYLIFLLFGIFFSGVFFSSQTGDREILDAGVQYLTICCVCSFGSFGQIACERMLQATGKTVFAMATQLIGSIVNLILDPIFIFGLGPIPAMGVAGAAIATVTGQVVAMISAVLMNIKLNREIQFRLSYLRPHWGTIKDICTVGVPSIVMQSIGSVMTFGMNKILMSFTSTATAVFGVYFKLQSFVFMPVFGLNNGLVPIVSYNYGAGHRERIQKTIRLSMILALAIMLVGTAIFQIFPQVLFSFFKPSQAMLNIGVPALRLISISFLFAGVSIIAGSVFQALGNGMLSLIVSVVRQLVVLLPAAWLLGQSGDLDLVWLAFPVSEAVAVVLSAVLLARVSKRQIAVIGM